jgi:hypothetical protein
MTRTGRWVLLSAAIASISAYAEDKVEAMVDVVQASSEGNTIDPPQLAAMKETFKKQKVTYGSLKRLSSEKISIGKAPVEVKLPNTKVATLKLLEIKDDTARISVTAAPLKAVEYTLGKEGNIYQAVGKQAGGDLWLVISQVGSEKKQPRDAPKLPHPATPVSP